MAFTHVLVVVPVTDLAFSASWYERLFGRPPDNRPMDSLVEWRVTESGWLQVTSGWGQPGTVLFNLAVDDLATDLTAMRGRGLEPGPVQDASRGVQLSALTDPDGNTVTLIGGFRVVY